MKNMKPSLFGGMLLLSAVLSAAGVPYASATVTNYVGGCAGSPNFSTISAALASTPAPNVVEVCPGTYAEQIVITKPVTLEGIFTSNADQAFITVPSSGLSAADPCGGGAVEVCVANAGTVNITNLTVDGTGGTNPIGIEYFETSGTLNYLEVRYQLGNGVGIYLLGEKNTVTVENSNLHDFGAYGIFAGDGSAGNDEFTVKLEGNTLVPNTAPFAAMWVQDGKSVTISGNVIDGPSSTPCEEEGGCGGIVVLTPVRGSITKNSVFDVGSGGVGISVGEGVGTISVTSNTIFYVQGGGIFLGTADVTVTGNNIMQTLNGIDFDCNVDSKVTSNTMTAIHSVGLANVGSSTIPVNYLYDAPTLYSTCQ